MASDAVNPPPEPVTLTETLEQLGAFLGELCAAPATCDVECRAVTMLLDSSASRYWASFHALKKRQQEGCLNVAVLALAKSGKSTLLNALVGRELLPMNNVPETARICKIVHNANTEPYLQEPPSAEGSARKGAAAKEPVVTARGEAAVRERLQELNKAVRERSSCRISIPKPARSLQSQASLGHAHSAGSPSLLGPASSLSLGATSSLTQPLDALPGSLGKSAGGSDEEIAFQAATPAGPPTASGLAMESVLTIHAPVAALLDYAPVASSAASALGAGGSGGVRLQLLDTPGPNEAGEEELRYQVERLLDGVDVALYILDYTKLKTQDEAGMFERLRQVNPELVRRLSQRLFFVVNKVDAAQVSEGQDLDCTRQYVADLVTRQMGLEGFVLQPEQVLLLSARNALLSRLVLRGQASQEVKARFVQLAFGRFANPKTIPQDQLNAAAHALLADSGLPDLEAQVLAYLYTHAAAVKHLALVDDVGRLLAEVRNVSTSCAAALSASAEALTARMAEVQKQLGETLTRFDAVQNDADAIADEVVKEIQNHLQTLRGKLFSAIINTLDTSNAAPAADPTGERGAASARRWQGVRERFLSIFTGRGSGGVFSNASTNIRACEGGEGQVSYFRTDEFESQGYDSAEAAMLQAAGGAVARSRSKTELQSLLTQLHHDITTQIETEVREFWSVMEAVAGARHSELLSTLNTHLADLSKQVELAVSQSLEVRLSPVKLSLQMPDASQFHANLDSLLARGLVETREKHIRVNQKEVTERVYRRGGVCRLGGYWESVPRMSTVVEAYTLSVYEVVPSEITAHFISMIDNAVSSTQESLAVYVSTFISTQLQEARQQLNEYCEGYLGAMQGALDTNQRGTEHRLAALEQVQALLARLDAVSVAYNALKKNTDVSVPRAQEPIAYDDLCDLSDGLASNTCDDTPAHTTTIDEEPLFEMEACNEQDEQQQQHTSDPSQQGHEGIHEGVHGAVLERESILDEAAVGGASVGAEGSVGVALLAHEVRASTSSASVQGVYEASVQQAYAALQVAGEAAARELLESAVSGNASARSSFMSARDALDAASAAPAAAAPASDTTTTTTNTHDTATTTATETHSGIPPASPVPSDASTTVANALLSTTLAGGVVAGGAAPLARKSGVFDTGRPFDYGEAMSSQMSNSVSHVCENESDKCEGGSEGGVTSEEWDVVEAKEAQPAV